MDPTVLYVRRGIRPHIFCQKVVRKGKEGKELRPIYWLYYGMVWWLVLLYGSSNQRGKEGPMQPKKGWGPLLDIRAIIQLCPT